MKPASDFRSFVDQMQDLPVKDTAQADSLEDFRFKLSQQVEKTYHLMTGMQWEPRRIRACKKVKTKA